MKCTVGVKKIKGLYHYGLYYASSNLLPTENYLYFYIYITNIRVKIKKNLE